MIFIFNLGLLFVYFCLFFLLAWKKQNNGLFDIAWGFVFVLIALFNYWLVVIDLISIIVMLMIDLW